MKTSELMIGDWVNYRPGWVKEETGEVEYESESMFPIKLTCIFEDLVQYDDEFTDGIINTIEVADYEIFPIPLTAEILEKNGFVYNDLPFLQNWQQFGLSLYQGGNGYRINCGENVSMKISSVHELQHAIRLCGIDKTIEL